MAQVILNLEIDEILRAFRFFSFFGENWGCPGLPFPFTPCGFHRDPGGTEGSGNEHQDPPQL